MFTKEGKALDLEIKRVLELMSSQTVGSDEYNVSLDTLKVLYEARGVKSTRDISADAVIGSAVSILGILMVLYFEKTDTITSKAFGWIFRKG